MIEACGHHIDSDADALTAHLHAVEETWIRLAYDVEWSESGCIDGVTLDVIEVRGCSREDAGEWACEHVDELERAAVKQARWDAEQRRVDRSADVRVGGFSGAGLDALGWRST